MAAIDHAAGIGVQLHAALLDELRSRFCADLKYVQTKVSTSHQVQTLIRDLKPVQAKTSPAPVDVSVKQALLDELRSHSINDLKPVRRKVAVQQTKASTCPASANTSVTQALLDELQTRFVNDLKPVRRKVTVQQAKASTCPASANTSTTQALLDELRSRSIRDLKPVQQRKAAAANMSVREALLDGICSRSIRDLKPVQTRVSSSPIQGVAWQSALLQQLGQRGGYTDLGPGQTGARQPLQITEPEEPSPLPAALLSSIRSYSGGLKPVSETPRHPGMREGLLRSIRSHSASDLKPVQTRMSTRPIQAPAAAAPVDLGALLAQLRRGNYNRASLRPVQTRVKHDVQIHLQTPAEPAAPSSSWQALMREVRRYNNNRSCLTQVHTDVSTRPIIVAAATSCPEMPLRLLRAIESHNCGDLHHVSPRVSWTPVVIHTCLPDAFMEGAPGCDVETTPDCLMPDMVWNGPAEAIPDSGAQHLQELFRDSIASLAPASTMQVDDWVLL